MTDIPVQNFDKEIQEALVFMLRSELRPDEDEYIDPLPAANEFTSRFRVFAAWLSQGMERGGHDFEINDGCDALEVLSTGMQAIDKSPLTAFTIVNVVQMVIIFSTHPNLWQWLDSEQQERFMRRIDDLHVWFTDVIG